MYLAFAILFLVMGLAMRFVGKKLRPIDGPDVTVSRYFESFGGMGLRHSSWFMFAAAILTGTFAILNWLS